MIVSGLYSITVYSLSRIIVSGFCQISSLEWKELLAWLLVTNDHHNPLFASKTAVIFTLSIIQLAQLLFLVLSCSFTFSPSYFSHSKSYLLAILGVRGERGSEEKMERLGLFVLPPPSSLPCPSLLSPLPCPSILRGFGHETPGRQHTSRGPRPRVLP